MVSSYWTTLSKAEYAILFKNLISRTSSIQVTKTILSKVDLVYLRMMTSSGSIKSERILNFFKKLGPEIQKFAGALQGHRANKGIFITTSVFTREAEDYVAKISSKIVLIGGEQLSQLMIDHNVGVALVTSYETKKIDSDYFIEG